MPATDSPIVRSLHQILFWPVQICAPEPVCREEFLDKLTEALVQHEAWTEVGDLYAREVPHKELHPHYSEFVYFHRFVQGFLYNADRDGENGTSRPVVRLLKRRGDFVVRKARVVLGREDGGNAPVGKPFDLDVKRVYLYLFQTQVAILVVELSLDDVRLPPSKCQNLLDQLRRAYTPYWFHNKEGDLIPGHCPHRVVWLGENDKDLKATDYCDVPEQQGWVASRKAPPVAQHWQYLLSPLQPGGKGLTCWRYEHIEDERIPTMAHIAVDRPELLSRYDFVRLALLDGGGGSTSPPYAPAFLESFEKDHCYDRFWDASRLSGSWLSTRYLFAGYSFVAVGRYDLDDRNGFFCWDGLNHFRHHYYQMGLIAYMQHASVLVFFNRLYDIISKRGNTAEFRKEVNACSLDFADFTSRFWSTGVTNHLQGREMFTMWLRHLGTAELFQETKQQIDYLNEVVESQAAAALSERAFLVSKLALYAAFIGSVLALAGIGYGLPALENWIMERLKGAGRFETLEASHHAAFWIITAAFVLGSYVLFHALKRIQLVKSVLEDENVGQASACAGLQPRRTKL